MLSGELATFLTGRYMEIHVLPLSFKEYISYYGENDVQMKYSKYLENGGFPYLINLDNDKELIYNYLDSIIKDHFPKILITFDFQPVSYHNGIKQINIIDFLLDKEKI